MQIKIFSIPIVGGEEENKELNDFLNSHRVVDIQQSLTATGYWTFCVRYVLKGIADNSQFKRGGKVDYKKELSEEHFVRFDAMRKARKKIADEAGIPAFVIFTDSELAAIAQLEAPSIKSISKIDGIGEARASQYGSQMIEAISQLRSNEKKEESTGKDS